MPSFPLSALAGPASRASVRNQPRDAVVASCSSSSARRFSTKRSTPPTSSLSLSSSSPLSSSSLPRCRRRRPSNLLLLPDVVSTTTTTCRVKLTESFDAHLHLDDQQRDALFAALSDPSFCARVSLEATGARKAVAFDDKIFEPVPWSPATKKGMPPEYEAFAEDKENYIVINVPAPVTFKANVLGKRCCAIYRIIGDAK